MNIDILEIDYNKTKKMKKFGYANKMGFFTKFKLENKSYQGYYFSDNFNKTSNIKVELLYDKLSNFQLLTNSCFKFTLLDKESCYFICGYVSFIYSDEDSKAEVIIIKCFNMEFLVDKKDFKNCIIKINSWVSFSITNLEIYSSL